MKLRIKSLIGFISIIALMGILGAVTYSNFLEINEQFKFLIEHDLQVLQNAQQLQKHIVDAETGQRGFIIVGEESFLEPPLGSQTIACFDNISTKSIAHFTQMLR